MGTRILEEIFAARRNRVRESEREVTLAQIRAQALACPPARDFAGALESPPFALIAEVKKGSPSKGMFRPAFDPVALARSYEEGGAAAISVVTEPDYFWGQLDWLAQIRSATGCPLLRKDFIFSDYQVWESKAAGADAILLILAMLDDAESERLMATAAEAGLACLVEVHDESEARRAGALGALLVGVNNRDLQTFEVRLETSEQLAGHLPPAALRVSESGIYSHDDCRRLTQGGYRAFLVGEALVTAPDPAKALRALKGARAAH